MQGHRHKSYNASGTTGSPYNVALLGKDGQNGQDIFAYEIVTDGTNGTPRVGTTTHGKQIGINYIIKY